MTRFQHDCDRCISLGTHNECDLYFCKNCDEGSVIARYGDEGNEYASSPCSIMERATSPALEGTHMRAVFVAFRLAIALGHYVERPKIAVRQPHSFNVLLVDGLCTLERIKTRLNDGKTMTFDERRELAARLDGVLRNETWEFTEAEQAAAETMALRDATYRVRRLIIDAHAELTRLRDIAELDSDLITRLELEMKDGWSYALEG